LPDHLIAYGWDDRIATLYSLVDIPGHRPARVIRTDRGSSLAVSDVGTIRATPYSLASRRHGVEGAVATGDWVALLDDPVEGWVVVSVLPRRSELSRLDPEPGAAAQQVLAANVDVVAVVIPLDRPASAARVERFAAVAWESGAIPAVILTKADLATDLATTQAAVEAAAPGLDVVVTCATTGQGVDDVAALTVPSRTLALLGPSGAGKSTLVNCLVGDDVQQTGDVRDGDHRGRHTTTARELIPIPGGGVLLDTPGVRSLGLWDVEAGLSEAFPEIDELAAACKFRDCAHEAEPQCAVQEAIATGVLEERRFASYRKLEREMARLHQTVADQRARNRAWGRSFKQVKNDLKRRDPRRGGK